MEWQIIIALLVIVPVILLPVVFVWHLNTGGIFTAFRQIKSRQSVQKKKMEIAIQAK